MATGSASSALPRSAAGKHNPWLIAFVVSLATFMEVLDTTIANVSLRHIAGGLGASQDESTWIITSYLISNAIVLPISGWLANLIGRKRFYMICVALFTGSSFMCALAPNLTVMILCRVLQGLGGGGLAPTEQSIFADSFPPEQRSKAFAFYGFTVIVAPAIGPLLGGWLTESYSWHWIFLINLPIGLTSLTLIYLLVDEPEAVKQDTIKFRRNFVPDWLGFLFVALTFGCLQVVLDRFQQDDGFASDLIVIFAIVCVSAAVSLVWWEWRHPQPVFDVKLFKVPTFAVSNLLMLMIGFTLYSTTQLLPQFSQTLLGYDSLKGGQVLALGGLAAALMMPVAGIIKVPPKLLVCGGLAVTGIALIHASGLNNLASFWDLSLARVYQSLALPFLFVSITTSAYVGIPPERNNEASALVNLSRNLGGSIGISIATTELAWRTQFHHSRLGEFASGMGDRGVSLVQNGLASAQTLVQAQAQLLSYLDVFWLFGVAAIVVSPLALLLKNAPKGAGAHG